MKLIITDYEAQLKRIKEWLSEQDSYTNYTYGSMSVNKARKELHLVLKAAEDKKERRQYPRVRPSNDIQFTITINK